MYSSTCIDSLNILLSAYRSEYVTGSERWAFRCCELALKSLQRGNYGVGAILVDVEGRCLAEAGNGVFSDGYHSAAHAEMLVLTQFEEEYPNYGDRSQLHLWVSLAPCPMCYCRILAAGIGQISYLSEDEDGAMMLHRDRLPPAWKNLSQLTEINKYDAPKELRELAEDIASAHKKELRQKLIQHIRP